MKTGENLNANSITLVSRKREFFLGFSLNAPRALMKFLSKTRIIAFYCVFFTLSRPPVSHEVAMKRKRNSGRKIIARPRLPAGVARSIYRSVEKAQVNVAKGRSVRRVKPAAIHGRDNRQ